MAHIQRGRLGGCGVRNPFCNQLYNADFQGQQKGEGRKLTGDFYE